MTSCLLDLMSSCWFWHGSCGKGTPFLFTIYSLGFCGFLWFSWEICWRKWDKWRLSWGLISIIVSFIGCLNQLFLGRMRNTMKHGADNNSGKRPSVHISGLSKYINSWLFFPQVLSYRCRQSDSCRVSRTRWSVFCFHKNWNVRYYSPYWYVTVLLRDLFVWWYKKNVDFTQTVKLGWHPL